MIKMKHLTGLKNLTRLDIEDILELAEKLEDVYLGKKKSNILDSKVLATLFYEPSTRTRLSFETAMLQLGGKVISVADAMKTSSAWKGETIKDTIRTIENYCHVIAMRHNEVGAADKAVAVSSVPILNAGDGSNEHPTQALLDILTIKKEQGKIDGLKIVIVGDLKHTRATNSLTIGLSNFDVKLLLVSPPEFKTSNWVMDIVEERNCSYTQTDNLPEAIKEADVVYVCRIQKERIDDINEYKKIKGTYVVNRKLLEKAPKVVTVLHHLPRVGELSEDVDDYPGAAYFRQTFNGVLLRGALLLIVLNKIPQKL